MLFRGLKPGFFSSGDDCDFMLASKSFSRDDLSSRKSEIKKTIQILTIGA